MDDSQVVALAARFGKLLLERQLTAVTVESCTGGLIARALTETAGSSAWFDRGWVTYSNQAKTQMVGVQADALQRFGAVSEQVALQMAGGGLACSQAGIALAVTGIAGPTGGSPEKPVGTVCFGWAVRGGQAHSQTVRFVGDRTQVRLQAAQHALACAMQILADGSAA
ncbi:MAG: nicotinamide-nucleotide amidohydrolase family protein [Quisquiliibacterium sp.]